jgi:hypothetical protein
MMTINLKIITIIAIVAALFTWLVTYLDKSSTSSKDKLLYSKLVDEVNDLTKISISSNNEKVTLERSDKGWIIKEKYDFSADKNKIRKLVSDISNSMLKERKTKNPDNYEKLGLDDNQSTKINLYKDSQDSPLVNLKVGDVMHQLGGSYVKKESEKQTWLVSNKIEAEAEPKSWINSKLFSIDKDRIKTISITHNKNQHNSKVTKGDDGKFSLSGIAKNKKTDEYLINNIISKFENFEIEDVEESKNIKFRKNKIIKATSQTKDGLEIVLYLTEAKDRKWTKIEFVYDKKLIEKENKEMSSAFETKTKHEADTLNKKVSGFAFEISDYDYKTLTKKRKELTK